MAHKAKVNGTVYEIAGGKTSVNGTGYDIKNGRTLVGGTGYEISVRSTIGNLPVGSSVFLNVNDVSTEFLVVHQGNPDAAIYDSSCDGTWVMMKDIYTSRAWHSSNANNYANSTIHNYLNDTFFRALDNDFRNAVKEVKIPYYQGNGFVKYIGANGLEVKVFLLSNIELGLGSEYYYYNPDDGAKLDYFIKGEDFSACQRRFAYLKGVATNWWTRSPVLNSSQHVMRVDTGGEILNITASTAQGIRPAFILPSDFENFSK